MFLLIPSMVTFFLISLACHIWLDLMCEHLGKPDLHVLFSIEYLDLLPLGYEQSMTNLEPLSFNFLADSLFNWEKICLIKYLQEDSSVVENSQS